MKASMVLLFILLGSLAQAVPRVTIDDQNDLEYKWIKLAVDTKGKSVRMADCPVIGNLESGIYHVPGQSHYERMLIKNKCVDQKQCKDNRRCFESEQEAQVAMVYACPLDSTGKVQKCKASERVERLFIKAKTLADL